MLFLKISPRRMPGHHQFFINGEVVNLHANARLIVQIKRRIKIVIFVKLSRTGVRCQAKLLTSSPQTVSKKSYLSILANDEF